MESFPRTMKNPTQAKHSSQSSIQTLLLEESEAMAKYALTSGLAVPAEVVEKLEHIAARMRMTGSVSDSLASETNGSTPGDITDLDGENRYIRQLAMIHDRFARLVAPATPRTIHLLAVESAKTDFWHFLGPVPLVRRMMWAAIIFLVAIVGFSLSDKVNWQNIEAGWLELSGSASLYNLLFLLSAAGIGASFQALFEANRYVVAGIFDPKYESSYWIRFVLGLIAGLILAELVPLGPDKTLVGEPRGLGKPTLAMLGGFSSVVVYQITNRLVTTVESLVRGERKDIVTSQEQAAKARANEELDQNRLKLAGSLISLQQQLSKGATPEQLNEKLGQLLKEFTPSEVIGEIGSSQGKGGVKAPSEQNNQGESRAGVSSEQKSQAKGS